MTSNQLPKGEVLSLPKGWEVKKLWEVCEFEKKQGLYNDLIYVGLEDIQSDTGKFIGFISPKTVKSTTFHFSDKHVLYGRLRPYLNKVLVPDFEGHCSTEIFPIKPGNYIERNYLASWLMQEVVVKKINATCTGARMPRANMNEVLNFEIPVPPLPEQKRIVSIIDNAFESISTAKNNAEKNLKNARELFDSYLQSVFTHPGEDWKVKKLGEVCEYEKSPCKNIKVPYIGLEDIQSNTGKLIGDPTQKNIKSLSFAFNREHVLYGRLRPYLNKVFLPDFEGHCSTEIFPLKPNKNVLGRSYLFNWLISSNTMKKINATWTGATLPRANMNAVLDFEIPLPPLPEQQSIVKKLDAVSAETKKLEAIYQQKLDDLDELKKSILDKAFKGEL